ncbi:putative olfactory receptor 2B8, partial [Enhydra lutris kenyoni]|uniref:Olfactory receptor 2B8 n=1 Tax=Enhydra lutris kenyoni TaxID=391180 RepID=A0A2Y9IM68_ENHLU
CKPLQYTVIMHPRLCALMASASWFFGFANSSLQTSLIFIVPLCGRNKIDHFFCEIPPLLKLACVDTTVYESEMFFASVVILLIPVTLIIFSYGQILRAVLRIKSSAGQRKAFGTCGSHITVVSLFYGTAIYAYLQPSNNYSQDQGKFVSLFYAIVTPTVNPIIYTLRNKDVTVAMKKVLWGGAWCVAADTLSSSYRAADQQTVLTCHVVLQAEERPCEVCKRVMQL